MEQNMRGNRPKLPPDVIDAIRHSPLSRRELGWKYDRSANTIDKILQNKTYKYPLKLKGEK
jgi:hypothetical protein